LIGWLVGTTVSCVYWFIKWNKMKRIPSSPDRASYRAGD
jgi:hypothetical protein